MVEKTQEEKKITESLNTLSVNDSGANDFSSIAEKKLVTDPEDKIEPVAISDPNAQVENLFEGKEAYLSEATWEEMKIREDIKKNLLDMKFDKPSHIQAVAIPMINRTPYQHLIAQSRNGSGKTGAFLLGILGRVDENDNNLQVVIFAHTRELVNQIYSILNTMVKGTNIKTSALLNTNKEAPLGHICVTNPGLFENIVLTNPKKARLLDKLKCLVLDEADHMLHTDITLKVFADCCEHFKKKKIDVQLILFSATISDDDLKLLKRYINKAIIMQASKESLTLKNVRQLFYNASSKDDKITFIESYLQKSIDQERVIIFVNTREGTRKLQENLVKKGFKVFILMGGDMDPSERDRTIENFNKGNIQILITTNVLARGFDEKLVKLIVNFDLPQIKENNGIYRPDAPTYLHRIGRTGRFGSHGIGLTLIDSSKNQLPLLKEIEKIYSSKIEEIKSLDELMEYFKKVISMKF
jgi:ATP-dependent RNA helicase DDX19/DBP5